MLFKKKKQKQRAQDSKDIQKLLSDAISNLEAKELFDLAKQVSEKHLDESDEMYQFFHNTEVEEAVNKLQKGAE